jgi:hypothetical protein
MRRRSATVSSRDVDRGPGYIAGPNVRRELLRRARDRHAREYLRKRGFLPRD